MEQVITDIWPYLVTALISAFGMYFGAVHQLKVRVAVLEQKAENLQKRVDKHSVQYDEIMRGISDIQASIAAINATLNIIKPTKI